MFVDSHCHLSFPELHGRIDELRREMAEGAGGPRAVHLHHDRGIPAGARAGAGPRQLLGQRRRAPRQRRRARARRRRTAAAGGACRAWWPSARPGWTTTGSTAAASSRWNGSASASACTSARRGPAACRWWCTRAAPASDTVELLRSEGGGEVQGVFHCFTETQEVADAALDTGLPHLVLRHPDLQECRGAARRGAPRAAGALPDRDRQPVPGAGAVPRQDQPAGLCAAMSRRSWRS